MTNLEKKFNIQPILVKLNICYTDGLDPIEIIRNIMNDLSGNGLLENGILWHSRDHHGEYAVKDGEIIDSVNSDNVFVVAISGRAEPEEKLVFLSREAALEYKKGKDNKLRDVLISEKYNPDLGIYEIDTLTNRLFFTS